jgi:hypothetical protein
LEYGDFESARVAAFIYRRFSRREIDSHSSR